MNAAIIAAPRGSEGLGERIQRLRAEARGLAREHVQALALALAHVEQIASEIAVGGDAYPIGVREIARRLTEDCETRLQAIEAIAARSQ